MAEAIYVFGYIFNVMFLYRSWSMK